MLRFGVVGGLGFGLDAGTLALLLAVGVSPYAGRVVSVAVTIVFTWWLNRRMTFRSENPPSFREFGQYLGSSLAGATINYGIYVGVIWLGGSLPVALVLGTGVASVFNFFRYRALLGS